MPKKSARKSRARKSHAADHPVKKSVRKSCDRKSVRKSRSRKCKEILSQKIPINMNEYKKGLFSSRAQAIAVSINQVKKRHPECVNVFTK
jgi:hypothetical protein